MSSAVREFFRIPRRHRVVTGIDIGSHSVKVVCLERTKSGKPKLIHAAKEIVEPGLPDERPSRRADALRRAVGRRRGRLGWVVAAFPRELTSARIISLPTVQPGEIAEMVRFDAERHVPFPMEEAEISHQVLATRENYTSDVLLVSARRAHLENFLGVFREVGIDPDYVSVDVVGSCRPFMLQETDGRTVAVLDIGQRSTDLAVFRNGRIRFSRTLMTGTGRLEQYLHQEGCPPEGAADATRWDFSRDGAEQRWLEDLLPELRRTLQAFRHEPHGGDVDRVIVCGGLAHAQGVEERLNAELGIDTRVARNVLPPDVHGGRIGSLDPEMAAAVGVTLEALNSGPASINLLPREILTLRRREHNRGFTRQVATLLAMIALLVGGIAFNNFNLQSRKIAFRQDTIDRLEPRIRKARKMETELAILDSLRDLEITGYRVLRELYRITPEGIEIEDLTFTKAQDEAARDVLEMTAKASDTQAVLAYAEILLNSPFVASVEPGQEYQVVEHGVALRRFKMKAELARSLREKREQAAPPARGRARPS